ncbi:MAG: hypothetical protein NT141_04540 [candidate division WWE3 bacterium]|nr:hypothetical protein [candidate division WWE3 bacterium]
MLSRNSAQTILNGDKGLQDRLSVLRLASSINPLFSNPAIAGGFIRDTLLGFLPADCDVIFNGYCRNQPGISECVVKAESQLKLGPFSDWEFENVTATGVSGNMQQDVVGVYSNYTDWLTMAMCVAESGEAFFGAKTLDHISNRSYDIRFQGIAVWMGFRQRTYWRALGGVASRGMYLCHKLKLTPTTESMAVFLKYDEILSHLDSAERDGLLKWFSYKVRNLPDFGDTLRRFGVTAFS